MQSVEFRIRKLEELNEQTLAHLGVIHRFMATHMPDDGLSGLDIEVRPRRVSERSEVTSEVDSHSHIPVVSGLRQRRMLRSLTDATVLHMGQHFDDDTLKQSETSRENLSRNESSSSADIPIGTEDKKTISRESEESKDVDDSGPPAVKPGDLERDAISDVPLSEIRQDSGERTTRQNSRTRSESDDAVLLAPPGLQRGVKWAEPRVATIAGGSSSNQRSTLLAMRAEYTSITDELESYCGLLSPPRTPPVSPPPCRGRNVAELSDPEMAWHLENEHLRDAEKCDYQQMEDLIQRRYMGDDSSSGNEETTAAAGGQFFTASEHRHLKRSSAIDRADESRRPGPTISVTREIEQTLSRPLATRDSDEVQETSDKNVPAPASETMC